MFFSKRNDKFGLVDAQGNQIIPFEYEYLTQIYSTPVHEHLAKNFTYISAFQNKTYGVLDTQGNCILPFEYQRIGEYAINDLFVVCKNGKWGVVDKNNETVLDFEYEALGDYFVGEGIIAKKGGLYGIIRKDGSELVPFIHNKISYMHPADAYLKQPHWLLYDIDFQGRRHTFGYNYLPIDTSIYRGHTQLTGNFTSKSRCEYTMAVYAGNLDFGKIILKSDGEEWEQVEYSKYKPIAPEHSYKYALAELCALLEQKKPVDAKLLKTLFGKVHTWSYIFWEQLSPFLNPDNIFCVAELMIIGLKKAAHKEDIACGRKIFYEQGLRILHKHSSTPQAYEVFCQRLLAAVEKTPAKHTFLIDCFF